MRGMAAAHRAMTDRYCATEDREPCQAGNRAALSGNHRVPQSCRSRALTAERQPGMRFRIDRVRSCRALNEKRLEAGLRPPLLQYAEERFTALTQIALAPHLHLERSCAQRVSGAIS